MKVDVLSAGAAIVLGILASLVARHDLDATSSTPRVPEEDICKCSANVSTSTTVDKDGSCTDGGQTYPCISMSITAPSWGGGTEAGTCRPGSGPCSDQDAGACTLNGVQVVLTPAVCASDCSISKGGVVRRQINGQGVELLDEISDTSGVVLVDLSADFPVGPKVADCGSANFTSAVWVEVKGEVIFKVQMETQCVQCAALN